ncbi:MAG: Transcriptional regulatory protein ZraR [candidate division BRC1 bacterium ADurb.BinA292]|nr:MAG: Transcriptional regulatory protein ZraR [candidate division BRC1 bacterium ADurb.BinA292]
MSASPPATPCRLLVVEDDADYAQLLSRNLERSGFKATTVKSAEAAFELLADRTFDLILTDIRLPRASGIDLIERVTAQIAAGEMEPQPIVVLTSINSVDMAVEAMRKGAADYLTKEATRDEIALRLRKILEANELAHENRQLRRTLTRYEEFENIIGVSDAIKRVKDQVAEIAASDVTVLIQGETGVGKELVARALHRASSRARGPFIEVNCAALPDENLLLSELFGHERGAFTGAINRKRGHFELADGGTLFLDEVGELGPIAQARLLRATESFEFTRLGGERPIHVNCRLVFATNKDLAAEVKEGRFREDLYYRINVYPIFVPPLRARPEDIAPLARFFAARFAEKHHLAAPSFSPGALRALRDNPWPGNIRELRNVIERLSIRFHGREIGPEALHDLNLGAPAESGAIVLPEGGIDLEQVEESLVRQALQRAEWNQRRAAGLLGISVDRMNARVKKFGITHPSWRVHKGGRGAPEDAD